MNINTHISSQKPMVLDHIGWKYYSHIKKKAMEQEFSWTGLLVSLSIAFFIVITAASLLNLAHESYLKAKAFDEVKHQGLYKLEVSAEFGIENYINPDFLPREKVEVFQSFGLS
jgi:hypothetical protein